MSRHARLPGALATALQNGMNDVSGFSPIGSLPASSPRRARAFVFALLAGTFLFGLALTVLARREECWGDEGGSLRRINASWRQIYYPFSYRPPEPYPDPFDRSYVFDHSPPLYFAIVRAALGRDAGIVPIRLFSVVPAAAALLLAGWWALTRLGRTACLVATALYAVSPAILFYAHEIRPYAMPMLLAAAMPLGAWRFRQSPTATFLWLFFAGASGTLMHEAFLSCALSLAVALAPGIFRPARRRFALSAIAGLGSGALAALALLAPQIVSGFRSHSYSPPFSAQVVLHTLALPVAGTDGRHAVLGTVLVLSIALLAAFLSAGSGRSALGRLFLVLWLGPILIAFAARAVVHIPFFPRYAIFALPGWFMTAAWMADEALRRARPVKAAAFGLLAAILALSAFNSFQTFRRPFRPPIREVAKALVEKSKADDYFAVDPDWLGMCLAEQSPRRPEGRYIYLGEKIPQGARRIWIVGFPGLSPVVLSNLKSGQWQLEPDTRSAGMWLWRATRVPLRQDKTP